jgi:mannose/cellobiose epimerase-like protein (N-acyl-D-glucosamine 2-epimerase family)
MHLSRRKWLQSAGLLASLGGQVVRDARAATSDKHIDVQAFRQAILEEVDHWRTAAELPTGCVQTSIDRQWRPVGTQLATLTVQSRHIFMRARAFDLTRDPMYLESMRRIADFTLTHFRDSRFGGLYSSVAPDGSVVDDSKNSYSMAFALFGFGHATRVTGDSRYHDAALQALADIRQLMSNPAGFYWLTRTRDFSQSKATLSQNPMLHLYESLLALYEATGNREYLHQAQVHIESTFSRLFDKKQGLIPGYYGPQWQPLLHEPGGYVDIGDQIEWAYWWSRGVEYGFPTRDLALYGKPVLETGLRVGYDHTGGGIFPGMDATGATLRDRKKLWQQCELLRTLMNWAVHQGRNDLWPLFKQTFGMFEQHFHDAQFGGYFRPYHDNSSPPTEKDFFKNADDTYHVCSMYSEGLRLAGALNQYGFLGRRT